MTQFNDLSQVAAHLRKLGVDAHQEFVYCARGGLEGLSIGAEFFPNWELNLVENREAVARGDFDAVKSRRGADWSVEPPRRGRES